MASLARTLTVGFATLTCALTILSCSPNPLRGNLINSLWMQDAALPQHCPVIFAHPNKKATHLLQVASKFQFENHARRDSNSRPTGSKLADSSNTEL
jgi:hypothetical protein